MSRRHSKWYVFNWVEFQNRIQITENSAFYCKTQKYIRNQTYKIVDGNLVAMTALLGPSCAHACHPAGTSSTMLVFTTVVACLNCSICSNIDE